MKQLKSIFLVVAIVCSAIGASAQSNIEKAVAKIEKAKGVNVTYTEKRNPKTKKPYKSDKVINISDKNLIQDLQRAFEKDEPNAVEITRVNNNFSTLTFIENNVKTEYSISKRKDSWTIIITKRTTKSVSKRPSISTIDDYEIDLSSIEELLNDIDFTALDDYKNIDLSDFSDIRILKSDTNPD